MPVGNCPTCQIVFDELPDSTKAQFAILSKSDSPIGRLSFELRLRSDKLQTRARELGEASRHARASAVQKRTAFKNAMQVWFSEKWMSCGARRETLQVSSEDCRANPS